MQRRLSSCGSESVVGTLAQATARLVSLGSLAIPDPMVPAPASPNESERIAEVTRLGLLDSPNEDSLARVTGELARAFDVPRAMVSIVDSERVVWKAPRGTMANTEGKQETPRATSICGHVVAHNDVLVVEDILKDPRFANNPVLKEEGLRFYAGAPLRSHQGHAVGSLCIIDTRPRTLTARDRMLLLTAADRLMADIERQSARERPVSAPS